jgi:hypothetical protein
MAMLPKLPGRAWLLLIGVTSAVAIVSTCMAMVLSASFRGRPTYFMITASVSYVVIAGLGGWIGGRAARRITAPRD